MATVIDSLVISMGMDSAGVKKGMNQAQATISQGVSKIMSLLGPLATAFSFKAAMNEYTQTADALGKMADSLGVDIADLDAWGQAVARAGGTAEGFQNSLGTLNKGIQQLAMTGGGKAKEAFALLGISAKDATGNAKDAFEVLREMAAKTGEMNEQQFMGIAMRLGLDKGTIMLLQQGADGVDNLVRKMKLMSYQKEDGEIAARYNDAVADMGKSFNSVSAIIMRMVVPAFSSIFEKVTDFMLFLRQHEVIVKTFFATFAAVITARAIPAVIALGKAFLTNPMFLAISAAIGVVTALALVIEDLWVYMQGGKSALSEYWSILGTGPELMAKFQAAIEKVKDIGGKIFDFLCKKVTQFFSYFSGILQPLVSLVSNVFKLIEMLVTDNWDGIGDVALNILKAIGSLVINLVGGAFHLLADIMQAVFSKLGTWIGQGLSALPGLLSQAGEWIGGILGNAFQLLAGIVQEVFSKVGAWIGQGLAALPGLLAQAGQWIGNILGEAFQKVKSKAIEIFEGIVNFVKGIFGRIGGFVTDTIKGLIQKVPSFMLPKGLEEWANSVDETVKDAGAKAQEADTAVREGGATVAQTAAATPVQSASEAVEPQQNITQNNDNSKTVTVGDTYVTVNAQTNDPNALGNVAGKEVQDAYVSSVNSSLKL